MTKKTIELEELVCPMCATKIEKAVKKLKGIEAVEVSYNSSRAKVSFDENEIEIEKIIDSIENVGYEVKGVK